MRPSDASAEKSGARVPARSARSRTARAPAGPARSSSSRSSHSSGTSCEPSAPWVSPGSGSPCQSLPPVRSRPSRSAMSVSRARSSAIVAGVAGLDRVETLALEPLEERARAPLLEVRDRDDAAAPSAPASAISRNAGQRLVDEGGPARGRCSGRTPRDTSIAPPWRTMARATCGRPTAPPVRLQQHVLELEGDPEPLQPGHHLPAAADAVGAAALQEGLELGRVGRQEVRRARASRPRARRELNSQPPTTRIPRRSPGRDGRGHAGDGVVIGECDGARGRPRPRAPTTAPAAGCRRTRSSARAGRPAGPGGGARWRSAAVPQSPARSRTAASAPAGPRSS